MLTEQEQKVLDLSADLWNEFLKLPVLHEDDNQEIRFHIHAIQNNVMSRPVFIHLNNKRNDTE